MSSFFFINLIFSLAFIVYIWAYSDFLPYYLNLLKSVIPKKLFMQLLVEEYMLSDSGEESYIKYFFAEKGDFFEKPFLTFILKLLSCPVCFAAWTALVAGVSFLIPTYIPILFFSSLLIASGFHFILRKLHSSI